MANKKAERVVYLAANAYNNRPASLEVQLEDGTIVVTPLHKLTPGEDLVESANQAVKISGSNYMPGEED